MAMKKVTTNLVKMTLHNLGLYFLISFIPCTNTDCAVGESLNFSPLLPTQVTEFTRLLVQFMETTSLSDLTNKTDSYSREF